MKAALFFNSPYLGGAERSFLIQGEMLPKDCQKMCFVPRLGNTENRSVEEALTKTDSDYKTFSYPSELFSVSRDKGLFLNPFVMLANIGELFLELRSLALGQYDVIWASGNKIALILMLFCKIFHFKGTLIWHFRDYPARGKAYRLIWLIVKRLKSVNLRFIANSYSVKSEIENVFGKSYPCEVLYNPPALIKQEKLNRPGVERPKILGLVSMFAPWKGLHQALFGLALYGEELSELGIQEIRVYGGEIYKTKGEHSGYGQKLESLVQRLPKDIKIVFCGLKPPEEAFESIDILIHSSIKEEPFGRVIIEAFQYGVPVISTCLGGANELIEDGVTGIQCSPYDYAGQFQAIQNIVMNNENREKLIQNAFRSYQKIQDSVEQELSDLISSV